MTDNRQEDDAFDAEQLAALARPSLAPTATEDDDDDDGALDLKALAASMAPPAHDDDDDDDDGHVSMAPAAVAAKADSQPSKADANPAPESPKAAPKASEKPAVAKAVTANEAPKAAEESGGGAGKIVMVLVALLGIGGAAFALTRPPAEEVASNTETTAESAEVPTAAQPPANEPTEPSEPSTPSAEALEAETPTAEEPAEGEIAATDESLAENAPDEEPENAGAETDDSATSEEEQVAVNTGRRPRANAPSAMTADDSSTAAVAAAEPPSMETVEAPTMESAMESSMASASSMNDMDDLLSAALGGTPVAGGTQTQAIPMQAAPTPMEDRSSLPETPSRTAVTRVLQGLIPRMRRCAGDQNGVANARLRVNNDGEVVSANVGGSPFGGTPQGACMQGVIRTARFPRFQRSHFDVTYPFSIRQIQ